MKHLFLFLLISTIGIMPLEAHRPILNKSQTDGIILITENKVSQVIYQEVDKEGKQLWLQIKGKAEEEVYFSIGIPAIDRLKDFRPHVALIGPGRPPMEMAFEKSATEQGIIYHTHQLTFEEFKSFHEPFTNTYSWILLEQTVTLPEDGVYYLVGYAKEEDNAAGRKFWLSIGKVEKFGFLDLFAFDKWKRTIRKFHEVK